MINDLRDARRLKVCIQTGSDMQRTSTSSAAQESHCLLFFFFIFPFFQLFFFYILYFVFCKNFSLFLSPFFLFLPFLLSYTLLFSLFLIFSTLVSFMNKYMSEQTNTTSRFPQYLFWHLPLALCLLMACLQDSVWNFRNLESQRIISITNFEKFFLAYLKDEDHAMFGVM